MDPELNEAADAVANDPSSLFDALPDSAFEDEPEDGSEAEAGSAPAAPVAAAQGEGEGEGDEGAASEGEGEGEGQAAPEPEDGDAPGAQEAPPAEPDVIAIDGKPVPIAEVRAGYLRQADYERHVTHLAGQHQALEGRAAALAQNEGKLNDVLEVAMAIVQSKLPQPPDPSLIDTDVIGFTRQQVAYEAAMKDVQKLIGARQQLRERQEQERSEQGKADQGKHAEMVAAEARQLFAKMPEMKTPEGRQAFMGQVAKHGHHYGLTPEVINGIQDHRAFQVIRDAMAFREQQAKKPAVVAKAQSAPPLRQAARPAAGARDAASLQAARQRLQREGSLEAAAALLPDDLFE